MVDPAFAKKQLDLLTREWYMKPDGQIPAYEWNFSDGTCAQYRHDESVEPTTIISQPPSTRMVCPQHFDFAHPDACDRAVFRVFKIERKMYGREDLQFLERVFQKLLINFTWYARP